MIQQIRYNTNFDNINFKGYELNSTAKFCGKYLKNSDNEMVSGMFIKRLKSGKSIFVEYKNGLLRKAGVAIRGNYNTKTYSYNASGKLIKVQKNGDDVFVKDCGYIDSDEISYFETINNGKIELGYNSKNEKIVAVIKPKLLRSLFTYGKNFVQEMRYKITNAETDGHNFWIYKGKNPNNKDYSLETDFLKKIFRNKKNGVTITTTVEMKNTTKLVEKDKEGNVTSVVRTAFNDDAKPVWVRETDADDNLLFERKLSYDNKGNIIKELVYDIKSLSVPYYKEIFYNSNGQILKEKLYNQEKVLQNVLENTYNENSIVTKSEIFNSAGKMLEREVYEYNDAGNLVFSRYSGSGEDGLIEGYYRYENNKLKYESEKFADSIEESYYDENKNLEMFVISDLDGNPQKLYEHTYKNNVIVNTRCEDGEGNIFCTIDHEIINLPDKNIHNKIYRDKNGKFIVKEKGTYTDDDVSYAYFDENGKSVPLFPYLKYINY